MIATYNKPVSYKWEVYGPSVAGAVGTRSSKASGGTCVGRGRGVRHTDRSGAARQLLGEVEAREAPEGLLRRAALLGRPSSRRSWPHSGTLALWHCPAEAEGSNGRGKDGGGGR